MTQTFYAPKPGRFGTQPMLKNNRVNTGTLAGSATTTFNNGGSPVKSWIDRISVCAQVYPTATSCTLTVSKVTGATVVPLTAALDINAKTADVPIQMVLLTTTTDAQRTMALGDSLRVTIIVGGAVSVQPTDLTTTISLLALE